MPPKGHKSTDVTRDRIRRTHWTKKPDEEKQAVLLRLREARAEQVHPSLVARGITAEMVADAEAKGMVWCSGECKEFRPREEFGTYSKTGDPLAWCRKCYRNYMRAKRAEWTPERRKELARKRLCDKYGVTPEWFHAKLSEQGGACALCGNPADGRGVGRPHKGESGEPNLCVDHNHANGNVRGLLCLKCNAGLERFESVPGWDAKALAYLARYS